MGKAKGKEFQKHLPHDLLEIVEAQRIILGDIASTPQETVLLLQGLGRVIAEEIRAPWDQPLADNSAMDGYAFSFTGRTGDWFKVTGVLPAGKEWRSPVPPGETVKIMTGAPIPDGCDTVVPVENVKEEEGGIRILREVKSGGHIRRRGEDLQQGEVVLRPGTVLRPPEIGMLASIGKASVRVFRKARVAVLATGDELIGVGSKMQPGKIFNSNSYSVACQVVEAGGESVLDGIAKDDLGSVVKGMSKALRLDALITTGGVSVGDMDFVKEAISELGGEIRFWKVRMKPGKPMVFAMVGEKPVFALPGNPVAAMVAFEQFVRPALLRMMGHTRIFRPIVKATLSDPARNNGDRPHLVRVLVALENGRYKASISGNQSSARLASMARGNGLLTIAPGDSYAIGDEVEICLLDRTFEMGEFK